MRTQLYFDVKDKEYFDRLQQYISANYGMYFEISDTFENEPNVCIISDYINKRNRRGIFLIKEDKGDASKFSSASEICSLLMEFNDYGAEEGSPKNKNAVHTLCVTSAAGGVGKSIVAQALCCNLALKGKKVLYINPNPFSACEEIFTDKKKNAYSRLRFYIRKMSGDISIRLKSLACTDLKRRVDYIINSFPSPDGFIQAEEASWFMTEINKSCCYDVIVFDVPSFPCEGLIEIMKKSNRILLVFKENPDEKHNAFRRFLVSGGIKFIDDVANFSKTGKNPIPRAEGIFTHNPPAFWDAVNNLCKFNEANYEHSN